jgi:hypothetical protein
MAYNLNAGAQNFNPGGNLVNELPSPYLEARLLNLEGGYADLHQKVDMLKDLYRDLHNSFGKVEQQPVDPVKSSQSAKLFQKELEQSNQEVRASFNSDANVPKTNGSATSHASNQRSLPPHLRRAEQSGIVHSNSYVIPLHLSYRMPTDISCSAPKLSLDTFKHEHAPLGTDGPVDTIVHQQQVKPALVPSPPPSPLTTVQDGALGKKLEAVSLMPWKPYYITTLKALPAHVRSKIPARETTVTFTYDFLQNTFDGIAWSPGLKYINSPGTCLLANRTYYMIDPTHEPYLPQAPGEHGAKLTAFFNTPPEDEFGNLPKGTNSYTNVPMFIRVSKGRYAYFGNYSQSRWSDKLDNETMRRVPQSVKEHIAEDLAVTPREAWVTQEIKKHFFSKPEYGGVLPINSDDDASNTVDDETLSKKMASDIRDYIDELAEWEGEAKMKTAMIKADSILKAFDAVSHLFDRW